jgi:SpoVK/Ycf46/Vps4 family AAA+-type ATPase
MCSLVRCCAVVWYLLKDERLKKFDPKLVESIRSEILERAPDVTWDDIAGLKHAKGIIEESIVFPLLRYAIPPHSLLTS